ncbi:MAG: DMT family transporter [Calditrichaeota bacterium]|nr:DMT family transporter [Calditrichota bacterium]RQW03947.1 MAG: DMT family transporter [Calditrichota bacterium]
MLYLGEIAGLATALCWSLTSIVFTGVSRRIGALQVNLYRLPLALILLAVTYFIFWGHLNISVSPVLWLSASGIVGLAIGDTFLFQALVQIGARLSMLLMSLAPPITAVLGYIFLNETIGIMGITGIFITVAGVSWVVAERTPDSSGRKTHISVQGILWGILAAIGQAVGLILAKKGLIYDIHPMLATLIRMAGATVILWPLSILTGRLQNPFKVLPRDTHATKLLLLGVIFGPYLGVTLSLVAVKYTHTGIAATLMSTMPVIMIPLLIFIEKEKPTWRAILGAVVAVAGVGILFLR